MPTLSQPPVTPTFIMAFACVGRVNWHSFLAITFRNIQQYFVQLRRSTDDNINVPLQRIENALGHFLHFPHTVEGKLTDISATGGVRVHLHYDNPLGRLTDVKRIVDNQAVETLVQYRYDDNGQLIEVINRNSEPAELQYQSV